MSVCIIARTSSNQANVTGAGDPYVIDWDDEYVDPYGMFTLNNLVLGGRATFLFQVDLKLSGMSALNTELTVMFNTTDGDIPFFTMNPSGSLLSTEFSILQNKILVANPDALEEYLLNIKVQVSGGLSNTVDVLAGSEFSMMLINEG